jgi:hypothetical protein
MSNKMQVLPLLAVLVGVGCSDATTTPELRSLTPAEAQGSIFGRPPEKLVAIGTSVSMGWASNGVYYGSQLTSWPALIGFGTLNPISLPLIQAPGCISPILAPLSMNKRLSGESLAGSFVCADNVQGVTLPTQNLGLAQALAFNALFTTPDAANFPTPDQPWYYRVLPHDVTQVDAAIAQHPTVVSVELGANEVLNGTSGLIKADQPDQTVVAFPGFMLPYDGLIAKLAATVNPKFVLVGLPRDGSNLASLRKGSEIWADRFEFAALYVDVHPNCENNQNYINVSILSLNMVFAGAQAHAANQPNPVYSCADHPGIKDLVLTPGDITTLNNMLGQMDDHIKAVAKANGYAYFSLGALYGRPDLKGGPYSIIAQLTSKTPYGFYTSNDGVHPNALGSAILAGAAAFAFNSTYGGHDVAVRGAEARLLPSASQSLSSQLEEEQLPALALEQARQIAAANAGRKLSPCIVRNSAFSACQ